MAWFVQITGSEATGCQVIVHFYVVPDVFTIIIIKIMITNMAKAIIMINCSQLSILFVLEMI